ncbi:hypothetical protein C0Q70_10158 [Pomacea canaliculata]|uniref:G-protein coupled receptors family 2 profile 1 domain-containing protein n=1 Tax=Pomacea canaliculata TaxID=400727 RepID=A0A2T7PBT4_POMCA|nr:hypothetical protein C0Q70_10158 [Pomacea canaliculata]
MGIPVSGASGYLSAGLAILLSLFPISTTSATTPTTTRDGGMCRSKSLLLEPRAFELHSCAWCYQYAARSDSIRAHPTQPYLYVINNRTSLPSDTAVLVPDVTNASDVKRVCSTVPSAICERWQECCHAARRCCQRQLQAGHRVNGTCARTWDGWSCWDDTPAGTVEYVTCPTFFRYPVLSSE